MESNGPYSIYWHPLLRAFWIVFHKQGGSCEVLFLTRFSLSIQTIEKRYHDILEKILRKNALLYIFQLEFKFVSLSIVIQQFYKIITCVDRVFYFLIWFLFQLDNWNFISHSCNQFHKKNSSCLFYYISFNWNFILIQDFNLYQLLCIKFPKKITCDDFALYFSIGISFQYLLNYMYISKSCFLEVNLIPAFFSWEKWKKNLQGLWSKMS